MAHTVFICHSSKDKTVADAACVALEAQRIPCWIAPRDILAGVEYGTAIIESLSGCQIVLLIFSTYADNSVHVRREIERGISYGKIIVPFRIENVLPTGAMEFAFSNTHWLDAITPPMEQRLSELCTTVARLLDIKSGLQPPLWHPQAPPLALTRPYAMLRRLEGHSKGVVSVAFSPDGQILTTGSDDGSIRFWDSVTGDLLRRVQSEAKSIVFSPDGLTIATCGGWNGSPIKIWDVQNGTLLKTLKLDFFSGASHCALSHDGRFLAATSIDNHIRLWNMSSGNVVRVLGHHKNSVYSIAFSPDGHIVVSGGVGALILWNVAAGGLENLLGSREGGSARYGGSVRSVCFSPNGHMLAATNNEMVELWDLASRNLLCRLKGHTGQVNSVAFSPDGLTLASGSSDKTVMIWAVSSGSALRILEGHTRATKSVAFSPDGRTLAVANDDTTITLWSIPEQTIEATSATDATLAPQTLPTSVSQISTEPVFSDVQLAFLEASERGRNAKDPVEKIRWYTEAITLKPEDVVSLNNRGLAYSDLNEWNKSLKDLDEAIRLKPDFATAYFNRGLTRMKIKDFDTAQKDLEEASRLSGGQKYYEALAELQLRRGDTKGALKAAWGWFSH